MSDKLKTKKYLLAVQMIIIAAVLLLNVFLFYSMECTNEYVQNRDVWGNTQTISRTDIRLQQQILNNLPQDMELGLTFLDSRLHTIEQAKKDEEERKKLEEKLKRQLEREESWKKYYGETPSQETLLQLQELQNRAESVEDADNYVLVRELIQETISYGEYISRIENSVQSMSEIAIFHDDWFLSNIARCQRDYYGLGILKLTPSLDYGVNTCINYRVTDVLIFCMSAAFGILLYIFYKNQNASMILSEPWTAVRSIGLLACGVVIPYVLNVILTQRCIGDVGANVALQSFSSYRTCPYMIKWYSFFGIWILLKLSACLLCCLVTAAILTCDGVRRYLLFAGVILFLGVEMGFSQYEGNASFPVFLREINVFSAVRPERFFNRYLNLNIGGSAVSRLSVFLLGWGAVLVPGVIWAAKRLRRFQLQVQKKVQTAYYEEINQRYQETRQMWHDFHNHLLAIQSLHESGDAEGANRYVKELTEQIDHNLLPAKTGCNPVDMLLFKKNQLAVGKGITCRFIVGCSLAKTGISEFDLCSILGNLMDNAIEAVEELSAENRFVELTIKKQKEMMYLSCENPYSGERKQERGQFLTTKTDSVRHGIGLASIRQISKKYRGYINIQTENHRFLVQVLLNEKK